MTTQPDTQTAAWIAVSGKILGTLFYHAPESADVQSVLALFRQHDWTWGDIAVDGAIRVGLACHDDLNQQYQDLFIGPNALSAAPWGSVYLDEEGVLFGDSTLALQAFMRAHRIDFMSSINEPEDHIGLMLMLAAYLAEAQPALLAEYLRTHLLTWSGQYLHALGKQRDYPFYRALAELTQATLVDWQRQLGV